jgi:hypothetical protein
MEGTVAIRNAAFPLPAAGRPTPLDTTIQLTPDKIVVPQFVIRDNHDDPLTIAGPPCTRCRLRDERVGTATLR